MVLRGCFGFWSNAGPKFKVVSVTVHSVFRSFKVQTYVLHVHTSNTASCLKLCNVSYKFITKVSLLKKKTSRVQSLSWDTVCVEFCMFHHFKTLTITYKMEKKCYISCIFFITWPIFCSQV